MFTAKAKISMHVLAGPRKGEYLEIPSGEVVRFGRAVDPRTSFKNDLHMSGVHFELENRGDTIEIRDLRSRNSTYVNESPVTNAILKPGDYVIAGKTLFQLQEETLSEWSFDSKTSGDATENFPNSKIQDDAVGIPHEVTYDPPYRKNESGKEILGILKEPTSLSDSGSTGLSGIHFLLPESDGEVSEDANQYPIVVNLGDSSYVESHEQDSNVAVLERPVEDSVVLSKNASALVRLERTNFQDVGGCFWELISRSELLGACKVVAHFKKIGMATPSKMSAKSVYSDLTAMSSLLPVLVDTKTWLQQVDLSVTTRLLQSNGLMLVSSLSDENCTRAIQELGQKAVPGFSELDGFLGWCWPREWTSICENLTDMELRSLLGQSIRCIVFPSGPHSKTTIQCVAVPGLEKTLRQFGFTSI